MANRGYEQQHHAPYFIEELRNTTIPYNGSVAVRFGGSPHPDVEWSGPSGYQQSNSNGYFTIAGITHSGTYKITLRNYLSTSPKVSSCYLRVQSW